MALTGTEKTSLVQMAMKRVNVVPYGENRIAFGTNNGRVEIGDAPVTVCEAYINITEEGHTCHVGFSAQLTDAACSAFYIEVDGNERSKRYVNTNRTMQFFDMLVLGTGLHSIVVKASSESPVAVAPREAMLGVHL